MRRCWWIASLAAVLVGSACDRGETAARAGSAERTPQTLTVATVRAKDLRSKEYLELSGLLFASQDVAVMAAVPGDVARIYADEGSFVKKGEPLAILDQREFRIAVSQAGHQAEAARLAVKQLELDHARNQALHEAGSVTDSQLEQISLQRDLAQNQWALAQDGLRMARKKLEDTVIRAPFDCYVTNRLVSVGSHITAMPPTVLFRVVDLAHLEFKMQIPDVHLAHVAKGDRVVVRFEAANREVEATVDEVISSVDPRSMTFTAVVKIVNAALDYALKPGMMGTARLYGRGLAGTFLVEQKHFKRLDLGTGKGELLVAVGGSARAREVPVERVDDLRVRVTGGLADEDLVIVSAVDALQEGQAVQVTQ